jgi:hypothetical protein
MKWAKWGLLILAIGPARGIAARPQSTQADPVAMAAKKARERKQTQAKPPKVWDNDNIPKNGDELSVIGQVGQGTDSGSGESPTNVSAGSGDGKAAAPAATPQKSAIETEIAAAKEQLQTLQNDLDILQRKYTLDQQMYAGKPDYASDKAGAANLKDEQDEIDAKQQEMSTEQQKIADLQAKLEAAPAAATEPKK